MKIEGKFAVRKTVIDKGPDIEGGEYEFEAAEIYVDGKYISPLDYQQAQHASTEFQWGYGGAGPAFLAYVLLLIATGDKDVADKWHQTFKWMVVARWPFNQPFIETVDIDSWLALRERAAQT